ncbi:WD domain, G-beta repeat protein [Ancylostoma duodenale]|uniref:Coronin-7 n=1 Tax=Ancylostoma duodenale TaxID=51022 RepID=A0A0C2D3G1_9BILA|nr:WD domain, G-beta repeat protein [Ancylostoma duodenale]
MDNYTTFSREVQDTIFDLPIGNLSCTNNGIQASANYLAFHVEGEGGKLGALPIGAKGRRTRKDMSIVCAHGDQVDDFCFMTFNDDLLATCSRDDNVKIWRLSGEEARPALECEVNVGHAVLLDALKPHATASNIIAVASIGDAYIIDVEKKTLAITLGGFSDKGQSLDWSEDGKLLAISADKGRQVCVYDVRSGSSPIQRLDVHQGLGRESRVLFCGDRLLSSGFTSKRAQEVHVLDIGKWDKPIHTQEYVSTTGVLMPFYDPDTKLVFLVGKGTNKLFLAEFQTKVPYLSPVYEMSLAEQNLGACLGSKRNVTVMNGEVDTLYQLTKHSIMPIPCIVPRRSYRDFHADLFPDTRGSHAGCTSSEWLAGADALPAKISLAPKSATAVSPPTQSSSSSSPPIRPPSPKEPAAIVETQSAQPRKPVPVVQPSTPPEPRSRAPTGANAGEETLSNSPVSDRSDLKHEVKELVYTVDDVAEKENELKDIMKERTDSHHRVPDVGAACPKLERPPSAERCNVTAPPEPPIRIRQLNNANGVPARSINARVRPKSCVVGQMASKFRHVETLVGPKANNSVFSNLRNVNTQLPPEANGACVSGKFIAVPLKGPAGVIGIYDVDAPCKLPDGVMDGIFNKAQVTDLHWNPFDDEQLAVGLDVGSINFWRLTRSDGPRNEMQPEKVMNLGGEKVLCFHWHPMASDLMAVALSDSSIEIWECKSMTKRARIVSHSAPVLALSWSSDGHFLASIGKDLMLNVHQPQLGNDCLIAQKKVLDRGHAGRVLYACDDRLIVIASMTRSSARQVQLLDASSLNDIYTHHIDNGTQPLVPHYDYDSSVLFLSAKGSRIINMFEVCYDSPYLLPLTPYMAPVIGQAIAYHNKRRCNVMAVEFQRAWRLSEKSIEELIFRVPRVKKDVFQSDLFPDALITWRPALTAEEWLAGSKKTPEFESLKPEGVNELALSTEPVAPARAARFSAIPEISEHKFDHNSEPDRKEVQLSWSARIPEDNTLEQDHMEGVAEEEWTESL